MKACCDMTEYEMMVFWSDEEEKWFVDFPELPGCTADGKTPIEALGKAERLLFQWMKDAMKETRVIYTYREHTEAKQ